MHRAKKLNQQWKKCIGFVINLYNLMLAAEYISICKINVCKVKNRLTFYFVQEITTIYTTMECIKSKYILYCVEYINNTILFICKKWVLKNIDFFCGSK